MNAPARLGKYALRGELGRGAMGTVYDGWDPEIDRRVAIKTVGLPSDRDAEAVEALARFKRGAQAAGRLHHPNIVGVFDYGEAASVAFIVMEFVEGQTLKDVLGAEHISPDRAVRILEDVLAGLAYSHTQGVVHRDIKPGNVMITPDGRAKIADFGIARIESSSMTEAGTIMGTPAYMSPEQFMGQAVDRRSDIYSAGVMLYQLLTGERPFEGTLATTMHKVLNTVPPRPSELSVTAPPALDAVVARAMARRPDDRYPDANAFIAALRRGGEPAPGRGGSGGDDATMVMARAPAAGPAGRPIPAKSTRTKRSVVPVVAACVLLLGVAGGVFWFLARGQAPLSPEPARPSTASPVLPPPVLPPAVLPSPVLPPPVLPPASPPVLPPVSPPVSLPPPPPVSPPVSLPPPPPIVPPLRESAPSPVLPPFVPSAPPPMPTPIAPSKPTAAEPAPPPPARLPGEVRADIVAALPRVPCTLASVDVRPGPQGRGAVAGITGLANTGGPARALRQAVDDARPAGVEWSVVGFDGPYCPVVDLVRALRRPGASTVRAALASGHTVLRDGQLIELTVTLPSDLAGHVQIDYLQQNGEVSHLVPSAAYPPRTYSAGERIVFGRPKLPLLKDGWQVGEPFGTDMILVSVSTAPLFAQSRQEIEPTAAYLRELQAAIDAFRALGGRLAADLVMVETEK